MWNVLVSGFVVASFKDAGGLSGRQHAESYADWLANEGGCDPKTVAVAKA